MSSGEIVQDPCSYTVKIRDPHDPNVLGTGVIVSDDGRIVTCAHVIRAILGCHPREVQPGTTVEVYFSQLSDTQGKTRRATIEAYFDRFDDDVVVLKLDDSLLPDKYKRAKVGHADESTGNPFRSFGYPDLGDYPSVQADGTIMGKVDSPEGWSVQARPIQIKSQEIAPGMSGAGVLDTKRNHVVGLISEAWFPRSGDPRFRDLGWAVNTRVLSLDPLDIELETEPEPKAEAIRPIVAEETIAAVEQAADPQPDEGMRRAPAPIQEWVGREDLLQQLDKDFANQDIRITGLVGFGGEGKSSLARHWIDSVEDVEGIFWWGFYENREVEQFFEAALTFLGGAEVAARYTSASERAKLIATMTEQKRILFVLDGFEVMQHQEGDCYGELLSQQMLEFLRYMAKQERESFCLITTRTPLLQMIKYTSYQHRDVNRLSDADGRALLRKQGVKGSDKELTQLVNTWDGHALTLSLLGSYVGETLGGDLSQLDETPLAEESRYERVHRVLRRYDEYLGEAEKAFLTLFSAFRKPVKVSAFATVFRAQTDATALNAPIAALDDYQFEEMLVRLRGYRILRYDPAQEHYTTHPLIREHYAKRFKESTEPQQRQSHRTIKEYYLEQAGEPPSQFEFILGTASIPTLEDLVPLVEAVHHACQAGSYDEASEIRQEQIFQNNQFILTKLGAWQTDLAIMQEFFPDQDIKREPQVSKASEKGFICNEVGLCLMNLGRLAEAVPLYESSIKAAVEFGSWGNASISYKNLSELYTMLGALAASTSAAQDAVDLAWKMQPGIDRREILIYSLANLGRVEHLCGRLAEAGINFIKAEALGKVLIPPNMNTRYLISNSGIWHADHLRLAGDPATARQITESNLGVLLTYQIVSEISLCHRILGDLDISENLCESARGHYDEALRIARRITKRDVLIEVLLGLGRLLARYPQPGESARPYLDEALGYCLESGYRLYEADCRVALAWLHRSEGNKDAARVEAERAKAMSAEMGYHWGVVDAEEVLGAL